MEQEIRTINILHFAMCLGVAIFFSVVVYLIKDDVVLTIDTDAVFLYVVPFVALTMVGVGQAFGKKQLTELSPDLSLSQKLAAYRTALIVKMATIEAPALLSLVAFYLSKEAVYGGFAAVLLAVMLFHKPTREKIILDLSLTPKEMDEIRLKKNFYSDKN